MEHLFIARQPIYNRDKGVMGYELLYRNNSLNRAIISDGDQASCETILNTFMHIGIDNIAGSALAFINLPREFIVNENLTPMFNEQAVLEILEDIKPDEEVINGIKRLKEKGYLIALDDFVFQEKLIPFIELADFIKIDIHALSKEEVKQQLTLLKPYNTQFIAEKVETHELYDFCYQQEFDFFQGYFFCHPEMLKKKSLPSNKLVILNLIKKLQNPEIESDELEKILVQDITLSYKLLRYINSAAFLNNLKNWVSLIMMSKIVDEKPTK